MPGSYVSGDNLGRTQEEYDAYWKKWDAIAQKNSFLDSFFNRYAPGGLTANQKWIVENELSKIVPGTKYTRDSSGQLVASGTGDRTGQQEIDFLMNMYGLKRDENGNFVSKTYAGPAEFGKDPMPLEKFGSLWESIGGTVPETYKSQTPTTPTTPLSPTTPTATTPAASGPPSTTANVGAADSPKTTIPDVFKAQTGVPKTTMGTIADSFANMFGQGAAGASAQPGTKVPTFPTYQKPNKFNEKSWLRQFFDF